MRSWDAMGNADLCTCLLSWISTVQQNPPIRAGESTNFLATNSSLQSFLPFGGNYYFSYIFLTFIIDFLLLNCRFCHYLNCDFIYFVMVDPWNGLCPSKSTFLIPPLHTYLSYYLLYQDKTSSGLQLKFAPCFTPRIKLEFLRWWYPNNSLLLRGGSCSVPPWPLQLQASLTSSEYWIIYTK